MGLESVLKKIQETGESECSKMLSEAKAKADEIIDAAKVEAEKIRESFEKTVNEEVSRLTTQELSTAEIEARKIVLNAQKDLLDKQHNSVLNELAKLPGDKREQILKSLLKKASAELTSGTIRCSETDKDIISKNSQYKIGDSIDTLGGFILTSEDKTITLDMRYETLLNDFWGQHLREITEELFGKNSNE